MKIISLDHAFPAPLVAEPGAEQAEYLLNFPIPGPESPGAFVLLTVTPDGRPAAIMVDTVIADDRTVVGWLDSKVVVTFPKEAPWMSLRRELLQHTPKAEAQAKAAEAYRRLMGGPLPADDCPVHGVGDRDKVSVEPARDPSTGQYL